MTDLRFKQTIQPQFGGLSHAARHLLAGGEHLKFAVLTNDSMRGIQR